MRFNSTHQPKPSRRRGGRPKSPATIERERIAAEKARAEAIAAEKREAAAFAAFEAAESGDFNGFEFANAFHRVYNKADAIYTAEANDSAEAVTPWGVVHTGADGATVYVMNDAPRKIVYFNRSINLIRGEKNMKTLSEIKAQQVANVEAIKESKDEAKRLRAEFNAMPIAKRIDHAKNTPRDLRIIRKWEAADKKTEHLQKVGYILRNNYKTALAAQVLPVLCDLLQKYKGKKAGEKTFAKFRDELTKAAGVSVCFARGIFSQKSTNASIYEIIDGYRGGETIDIYTKNGAGFINANNEFCGLYESDFQAGYLADYIDDPEKRVDEIEQAAAEVKRIAAEYNAAADAYNALTVEGFENINKI